MRHIILLLFFIFTLSLYAQRSDFKEINFQRADNIANQYKGEELYNLPMLVHNLTATLHTDVERFRAIYYWVCHNISGDYDLMYKTDRARKNLKNDPESLAVWNAKFKKEVFNRLRHKKETLCTGYAYLVKEMSNLAGLECEIINGKGPTNKMKFEDLDGPNHSWNAIKLHGKWYLCDPTWSSGVIDMSAFLFEFNYEDTYFLMEPSTFAEDHQPLDTRWLLLAQDTLVIMTVPKVKVSSRVTIKQ